MVLKKDGIKESMLSCQRQPEGSLEHTKKAKKEAEKRLRQIEFFKHLKANPSLRMRLRKKSLVRK